MPTNNGYDASCHLSWGDVMVDDPLATSFHAGGAYKGLKTDPFCGISLFISRVTSDRCQVSAMLAYMVVRGKEAGPLFRFGDGRLLTRQHLVTAVKDALDEAGVDPGQ